MATKKISELPVGVALTGAELVPVVQSEATVQVDADAFKTFALGDFGAFGLTLSATTTASAARTALSVYSIAQADAAFTPAGTAQPLDADLTAIAALTSAANKGLQSTGAGTWALYDLTAAGKALLDDATASDQLTTLGVSAFVKTILDDADAAAVRATIGAGTGSGSGDVVGPASSTDLHIAQFDGTSGKLLKDGGALGALAALATVGTSQIDNSAVTLAKIANAAANSKLLGSGASGSGSAYVELTIGSAFTFATTTLNLDFATTSNINTGTDTTKAINSDVLAGSNFGRRVVQIQVSDPAGSAITTGDGKAYFRVPVELNGMNLVDVAAAVTTVSSSGLPTVQIANVTDAVDMLSTKLTIDANETDSATAATAAVIDTTKDDVATADMLRIDIDVAGTGAKGLIVSMSFQLP